MQWDRDGRQLLVWSKTAGPAARIDRFDLATRKKSLWREILPVARAGVRDIEAVWIARDARTYVYSYVRSLSDLYTLSGLR